MDWNFYREPVSQSGSMAAKTGTYVSPKTGIKEKYDSSYELKRMQALDSDPAVKWWTKNHGIKIPYKEGRKRRRYIPDFLVELIDGRQFLEEVKGFIYQRMNFARKNLAAAMWCALRGVQYRIVYKEELERLPYVLEGDTTRHEKADYKASSEIGRAHV